MSENKSFREISQEINEGQEDALKDELLTVEKKEIKKAEGKKTYKGLNDDFIKQYISIQDNAADLTVRYEDAAKKGKFPMIRKWFLDTFKNFDMETAKKEIEKAIFAEINSITAPAEDKPALVAMPEKKTA